MRELPFGAQGIIDSREILFQINMVAEPAVAARELKKNLDDTLSKGLQGWVEHQTYEFERDIREATIIWQMIWPGLILTERFKLLGDVLSPSTCSSPCKPQ